MTVGDHKVWRWPRLITEHAFDKLREVDCGFAEFEVLLENAEIIEEHDVGPEAVKELLLLLHWQRPLHVVVVSDERRGEERIVTVYEPSPERWRAGYRERR